jgi:hypothetical protein
MPPFLIFRSGSMIETIHDVDPDYIIYAVEDTVMIMLAGYSR